MNRLAALFDRRLPHFGQLCTGLLCGLSVILAACPFEPESGERLIPATVFSWLPTVVLQSPATLLVARVVLAASAIAWATRRLIPWSGWLTTISFTLVWSLRMENTSHAAHIFNVTNMLLVVHAMWYQFEHRAIREAIEQRRFWSTPLYPNWVFALSVFYICWFHTWAGLTKIQSSGFDWGNGLSLQLWVHLWGWPGSPTTQLLLASRSLTRILQTGALVFETLSILGILSKWCRWIVGFNLLGFYLGVLTTFVDYGFHANALIVAIFLLPVREWMDRSRKPSARETEHDRHLAVGTG